MQRFCASQRVILVIFISLHKILPFQERKYRVWVKKESYFFIIQSLGIYQALPLIKICLSDQLD